MNVADNVTTLETATPQSGSPYTISISCDDNVAIDNLVCNNKNVYQPTISSACTGTIRTNTYDTDVKIDFDKIIGMVEKCVGNSNTATNTGI